MAGVGLTRRKSASGNGSPVPHSDCLLQIDNSVVFSTCHSFLYSFLLLWFMFLGSGGRREMRLPLNK